VLNSNFSTNKGPNGLLRHPGIRLFAISQVCWCSSRFETWLVTRFSSLRVWAWKIEDICEKISQCRAILTSCSAPLAAPTAACAGQLCCTLWLRNNHSFSVDFSVKRFFVREKKWKSSTTGSALAVENCSVATVCETYDRGANSCEYFLPARFLACGNGYCEI
jgi:hypothetical protein